ncbi:2,3-butanediol dehydrogenase [Pseudomonas aeruginosa]|uniref:2,3-butanediol dehydrogenase n=2 Tax=Pseudomonas aeruginosa TaxID=287 RepID=UPI00106BB089|nr:2,3-butanediol dehydrogenase [Pseudomonas aeruginosa]HBO1760842.1 2,3-butanediol dehydrogenase [Pseudomonas aeruginosa]HCE9371773.1 2,3-butanediol dehydrogenase [Pseudomonas aeruginosa]HCE9376668.1 2,3-butanediol dehydrogenase [Pseudomonas aeruginosa]
MKALRWHAARDLRLSELERQAPRPGEVELEVAYCGICGSDLHEYQSGPHSIPQAEAHPLSGCRAPLTLGHEFCGVVAALGPGVEGLRIGDRVAVEPEYRCGECRYCREGRYNLCESMGFIGLMGDGGFAERARVPAYMLHRLPDAVGFRQAAVLEPAAVALHALRRSSLAPGQRCAVFGLGPIGLLLVMLARLRGIEDIVAIDVSPERLALAGEFGASRALDARDGDTAARLREGGALDCAFEAAGSQASLDAALASLRKGGELVLVSLMGEVRLDAFDLVNRELRLHGSVGYRDAFPELIALLADGRLDLARAVTRSVPLEQAVEHGFEALLRDKSQLKVLVNPNPALADA